MSDPSEVPAEFEPPSDMVLGSLGGGPHDSVFGRAADLPAGIEKRPRLPHLSLVGMRRSGGLRFTTAAVVVLRDGRVRVARGADEAWPAADDLVRQLSADELAALQQLVDQSHLQRLCGEIGRQSPDGYAYEIAARIKRRLRTVTVFSGFIPESLQPLIARLSVLLNEAGR